MIYEDTRLNSPLIIYRRGGGAGLLLSVAGVKHDDFRWSANTTAAVKKAQPWLYFMGTTTNKKKPSPQSC